MRPHWIAHAIAEVADLLIVEVRNGFVLERHDGLQHKSRSDRSGGETLFAGRESAARSTDNNRRRLRRQMLYVQHRAQLHRAFTASKCVEQVKLLTDVHAEACHSVTADRTVREPT